MRVTRGTDGPADMSPLMRIPAISRAAVSRHACGARCRARMNRNLIRRTRWRYGGSPAGRISAFAFVEELLARDLVVLDRVEADLLQGDAAAGGIGRDVGREMDGELPRGAVGGVGGAVEERAADLPAVDGVVRLPPPRLVDDGAFAGHLHTAGFDRDDVRGVHLLHHVEVLPLVAQV